MLSVGCLRSIGNGEAIIGFAIGYAAVWFLTSKRREIGSVIRSGYVSKFGQHPSSSWLPVRC